MGGIYDEKELVCQMVYTMEMLSYKGISIRKSIHVSLSYYMDCYKVSNDKRYLELAVAQIKAGLEFGITDEESLVMYCEVFKLAEITEEEILDRKLYFSKKVKLNKSQVRSIFRRWSTSRMNGMSLSTVVEDIIGKVKNNVYGHYIYAYKKYDTSQNVDNFKKDIYHLVINEYECYLMDIKSFTVYTFIQKEKRK